MLDNIRVASYPPKGKEKKAMKLLRNTLICCVLIVSIALLIFTALTRSTLCEVKLKDGNREFAAVLACGSGK